MSVSDFIKSLPCYDERNFSQVNLDQGLRTSQKRPSVYVPTEEVPSEQHIVLEKRCVLLRYLAQQWEKKTLPRKRDNTGESGGPVNNCKKRPRLEPAEMN